MRIDKKVAGAIAAINFISRHDDEPVEVRALYLEKIRLHMDREILEAKARELQKANAEKSKPQ